MIFSSSASAVPLLTGSAAELGAYDLAAALELKDDGRGPDLQPGDSIFTATVAIVAPGTVRYKVVLGTAGAIGTADGEWMQFELVGAGPFQVTFVYDLRPYPAGWAPKVGAISDSVTSRGQAGSGREWVAIGTFQSALGDSDWNPNSPLTRARDDGLLKDQIAGDGVYTYSFVAPLPPGAPSPALPETVFTGEFQFASRGPTLTTYFGTTGWGFATERVTSFTFEAQPGDLVTLELDAVFGRARSTASSCLPRLFPTQVPLVPGETFTFANVAEGWCATRLDFVWSSSNPEVASVDASGTVTAHGLGQATITVRWGQSSMTSSALIGVSNIPRTPVSRIELEPQESTIEVGQTLALTVRAFDASGLEVAEPPLAFNFTQGAYRTPSCTRSWCSALNYECLTAISVDPISGIVSAIAPAGPCTLSAGTAWGFQPSMSMWEERVRSNLVSVTVLPPATVSPQTRSGCGCGSSSAGAVGLALLLLLFRRARRTP